MAKKSSRRSRLTSACTVNRLNRQKRKLKRSEDARPLLCGSLIVTNWDADQSLADNYRRLGLCQDPNKQSLLKIARSQRTKLTRAAAAPTSSTDDEANDDAENPVRSQLVDLAANPPRLVQTMPRSMPVQEQAEMAALVAKYGDDVDAMARDIKLNRWQKTGAQLLQRLQIYRHLQSL